MNTNVITVSRLEKRALKHDESYFLHTRIIRLSQHLDQSLQGLWVGLVITADELKLQICREVWFKSSSIDFFLFKQKKCLVRIDRSTSDRIEEDSKILKIPEVFMNNSGHN